MKPGQRDAVREADIPIEGASTGDATTDYYLTCRTAILRGVAYTTG